MNTKFNFLEKILLELDYQLNMLFAPTEFGKNYRKYKGFYYFSPFERKRVAMISRRATNMFNV